jgi:thioredoxin-related protein
MLIRVLRLVILALSVALIARITSWQKLVRHRAIPTMTVGRTLPPVRASVTDPSGRQVVSSLRDIMRPGYCTIAVFYKSECPFCEELAKAWSGIAFVRQGARYADVRWISVSVDDSGRAAFSDRYELPGPTASLLSLNDAFRIGVPGTPTIYLLLPGIRLGGIMPRDLTKVVLPDSCSPDVHSATTVGSSFVSDTVDSGIRGAPKL